MKRKAMAFLVTLAMVLSLLPFAAFAADVSYTDIAGHWGESSIERWTDEGVVNGVGNDKFKPDDNMLRAEAAAVFARLLELVKTADISQFTDVNADDWFAGYISENVAYKLMNGTSATTMDPNDFITREQFFTIFARAMGIPGQDECNKDFSDLGDVSDWAAPSVNALINLGYVNGISDTKIAPQMFITRAMVMKVLDNGISDYLTESGTYSVSGRGIVIALADNVALKGNFSGWVVGSMDNGTIDLTGVNGAPEMWILKDNVKIVKNPTKTWTTIDPSALSSKDSVGAWITTSSVAFGTVSNGKDVANDSKVVIKGHRSGGGGGNSSKDPLYVVTAKLSVKSDLGNFAPELTAEFYEDANVQTIVEKLITDNQSYIQALYDQFVANLDGKQVPAVWKGDTGTLTFKVNASGVVSAQFTSNSTGDVKDVNLPQKLKDAGVDSALATAMAKYAATYGVDFASIDSKLWIAEDGYNLKLPNVNQFAEIATALLTVCQSANTSNAALQALPVGVCTAANKDCTGKTIGDIINNHPAFVTALQGSNPVLADALAVQAPYTAISIDYTLSANHTPGTIISDFISTINANDPDIAALMDWAVQQMYGTYSLTITGDFA